MGGDSRVVRDEDDREAVLEVELAEEIENLLARLRVEVAGRLIGDQKRAPVDQRAGDRDALLLAARELCRLVIEPVAQPDPLEERPRAVAALAIARSHATRR